jgi:hypothetical protein
VVADRVLVWLTESEVLVASSLTTDKITVRSIGMLMSKVVLSASSSDSESFPPSVPELGFGSCTCVQDWG